MLGGSGSVIHNRSVVLVVRLRCFTCLSPFGRPVVTHSPWMFSSVLVSVHSVHCNTFVLAIQTGIPFVGLSKQCTMRRVKTRLTLLSLAITNDKGEAEYGDSLSRVVFC